MKGQLEGLTVAFTKCRWWQLVVAICLLSLCLYWPLKSCMSTHLERNASLMYCATIGANPFSVVLSSDDKVYLSVFDFGTEGARGYVVLNSDLDSIPRVHVDNESVEVSLNIVEGMGRWCEMVVKLKDISKIDDFAGCKIHLISPETGTLLCEIELTTHQTTHDRYAK